MNADALAWIAVISLLATCFVAIAARSLHSFSRHELEQICQLREAPEKFAEILKSHESLALGVEIVAMMLAAFAIAAGSLWSWQIFAATDARPWLMLLSSAGVLGLVLGMATVWMPWSIARIGAAQFICSTWPLLRLLG